MNERLTVFKDFVSSLSTLSKCKERAVAAVITDSNLSQVYSIGINGGPKGGTNCLCAPDKRYGCTHAEINALVKCLCPDTDKIMIISVSPCVQCATAIINAPGGFQAVYWIEEWKNKDGIHLLNDAKIENRLI